MLHYQLFSTNRKYKKYNILIAIQHNMGKLLSYIVGLGLILSVSYYYLSGFYYPLVMWLGPVMGAPILLILGNLFFLLGNMANHLFLIPIYVILGVLIGLCSRKGRRAFTATVGVYGTLLSISSMSLFFILETHTSIINALSSLSGTHSANSAGLIGAVPPMPSGITLSSLTSEPLIQRIITLLGVVTSKGVSFSTSSIVGDISGIFPYVLHSFIIFAIEDLLVVMVSAILVGYLLGKRIGGVPKKTEKKGTAQMSISSKSAVIFVILLLILSMGLMSMPMTHSSGNDHATVTPSDQSTVLSCIVTGKSMVAQGDAGNLSLISGFVGKTGDSFTVLGSLENGTHVGGFIPGVSSPIMSLVTVSLNFSNLMNQLSTNSIYAPFNLHYSTLKHYYGVMSGGLLISIVTESSPTIPSSDQSADAHFIRTLGGANINPLISTSLRDSLLGMNGNGYVGISVYAFSINLAHMSGSVRNNTMMRGNTQESNVLYANLQNHLGTGKPQNISSFVFASGCVNSSSISALTGGTPLSDFGVSAGRGITFSLSIFEQNSVYHSSGEHHTFTMARLIGYSSNLSGLNESNTILIAGIPVSHNANGYNVTVYYQNSSLLKYINFGYETQNMPYGNTLDPVYETYTSNATFPAYLNWSEHTGLIDSNTHYISVKVTNRDNNTIYNVTLNASEISVLYPQSALNIQGISSIHVASLATGADLQLNFTVVTHNPGAYMFPPPELSYENNNTMILSSGNSLNIVQGNQSLYRTVNEELHFYVEYAAGNLTSAISYLNIILFPQFYLFDLVISLIIVVDIVLEIKMFARWRKNRKKQ